MARIQIQTCMHEHLIPLGFNLSSMIQSSSSDSRKRQSCQREKARDGVEKVSSEKPIISYADQVADLQALKPNWWCVVQVSDALTISQVLLP